MKRRSFLGSIAAVLGLGGAVPAVAEEPKLEAASAPILDDLIELDKAIQRLPPTPYFIDRNGCVWWVGRDDGKAVQLP